MSYRWEVDYKVVSEEKELVYLCDKLSEEDGFPCRLIVSNEDGSTWIDFTLNVTSPYEEGILIMSKQDNNTMLTFKREDKKDQDFVPYVYKLNNPDVSLGKEPKCMLQHGGYVYLATENPLKIVAVDGKILEASMILKYPADHIGFMLGNVSGYNSLNFFGGGREVEYDAGQDGFMNMFQQSVDMMYPGAVLADKAMRLYSSRGWPEGMLTYDNSQGILFSGDYGPDEELLPEVFKNKTLIDMVPCKSGTGTDALLVVQAQGKDPEFVHLNPMAGTMYSDISTTGSGITSQSVFLASQNSSVLYYSVGNGVYRYDYTSDGNFPQTPDYTVGNPGDVVRSIVLNKDESKLYIAYDSNSGELKGGVKCIVLSGDDEPWEKTGIAGEIVQMIYKE